MKAIIFAVSVLILRLLRKPARPPVGKLFRAAASGLARAAIVLVFGICVIAACEDVGMSDLLIIANLMVALAALFAGTIGFDRAFYNSVGRPNIGSNEEESFS